MRRGSSRVGMLRSGNDHVALRLVVAACRFSWRSGSRSIPARAARRSSLHRLRWYFNDPNQSVWHDEHLAPAAEKLAQTGGAQHAHHDADRRDDGDRPATLAWPLSKASNALMLFPLVTPEIVMGVALFLVFTQVYTGVPRGVHDTASRAHHIQHLVRRRDRAWSLGGHRPQYEEAARDLGANRLQAMRLVLLPLLGPAIFASVMWCSPGRSTTS